MRWQSERFLGVGMSQDCRYSHVPENSLAGIDFLAENKSRKYGELRRNLGLFRTPSEGSDMVGLCFRPACFCGTPECWPCASCSPGFVETWLALA